MWYNRKEELPKEKGSYIVATDSGAVCTAHWYGDRFANCNINPHITHWKPLPKHPNDIVKCQMITEEDLERMERENFTEVAPIIHAHWEDYKDDTMTGLYGYPYCGIRCTQCGTDPTRAHNIKYEVAIDLPYCPECGAKMDEEEGQC